MRQIRVNAPKLGTKAGAKLGRTISLGLRV